MDKYTENFCKDNPIFHFICPNPKCKKSYSLKSKDVFRRAKYSFKCSSCGEVSSIETPNFLRGYTKQIRKGHVSF